MSDWITYNTTGGTGNTTITITAASTTDLFRKLQTLRAETTVQHKTADVNIEQKGYYIGDYIVPTPDYVVIDTSGGTETIDVDASVDWVVCNIFDEQHSCVTPEPEPTIHYNLDMTLYVSEPDTQLSVASIYHSVSDTEISGLNYTCLVAYPINIDEEGWINPGDNNYPRVDAGYNSFLKISFASTGIHIVQFDLSKPYHSGKANHSGYYPNTGWTALDQSAVSKTYIGLNISSAITPLELFIPNICAYKPGSTFCYAETITIDDGFSLVLEWNYPRSKGELPLYGQKSFLRNMHIGEGVSAISTTLMSASNLRTLYLPSTLQYIDERGLIGTSSLLNIYSLNATGLPDNISIIRSGAFSGSSYAGVNGDLIYPSSYVDVGNIGPLTAVTSVHLSPYTKTIAGGSFSGWTSLTDIYIPCMFKPTIDSNMTGLNQTGTVHYPVYSIDVYEEIKNNFPSGWEIRMDITDNWVWKIGL